MPIHLLPAEVASQIAAGEVIERPASVVKELLENALDARARFIEIKVEGGGQRLVEVADDGCGIHPDELALAVERHATSKLVNAADLFRITTLGFRGEALASIGSVARLTLTSRPIDSEVGARLRVEGGIASQVQAAGARVGTVVRVEDLFYNVPARKKFLKQESTERRTIDELVTRYALAFPNVRFHLTQDERASLQTSGKGDRREVLAALYGVELARQMLEVLSEEEGLRIEGFISPPAITRSNRREIFFFVNLRPVQDISLVTALTKAYHTLLMVGRYPMAILFLDISTDVVDVNVHPTKAEVRFRDADRIFAGVQRSVRRALLAYSPIPGLEAQIRWSAPATPSSYPSQTETDWLERPSTGWYSPADQDKTESGDLPDPASAQTTEGALPIIGIPTWRTSILRLVGQIANTYLVAEGPDGLYLIDQHAAHERVLFERFLAQRSSSSEGIVPSQVLLQTVTIQLSPASARLLSDQLPLLKSLGFEVEIFGTNTFLIRSIPALLSGNDPASALSVLVEDFEEDETPLQKESEARLIARICKRAAVKGGKSLSPEEQSALLHDLETCQQPRSCPHGRPTMIHLSVDLLERQFGRRGPR
jgi:DNA mismatch repair protein MutL